MLPSHPQCCDEGRADPILESVLGLLWEHISPFMPECALCSLTHHKCQHLKSMSWGTLPLHLSCSLDLSNKSSHRVRIWYQVSITWVPSCSVLATFSFQTILSIKSVPPTAKKKTRKRFETNLDWPLISPQRFRFPYSPQARLSPINHTGSAEVLCRAGAFGLKVNNSSVGPERANTVIIMSFQWFAWKPQPWGVGCNYTDDQL